MSNLKSSAHSQLAQDLSCVTAIKAEMTALLAELELRALKKAAENGVKPPAKKSAVTPGGWRHHPLDWVMDNMPPATTQATPNSDHAT